MGQSCSTCGARLTPASEFCSACGADVPREPAPPPPASAASPSPPSSGDGEKRGSAWALWAAVGVLAVALAGTVGYVVSSTSGGAEASTPDATATGVAGVTAVAPAVTETIEVPTATVTMTVAPDQPSAQSCTEYSYSVLRSDNVNGWQVC